MADWNGPVDEQGRLSSEVTCRDCGYNLMGLSPTGMCPECGLEIGKSLQTDRLDFADPRWMDTLAKGSKLLAWWLVLGIVLGMVVGGVLGAVGTNNPQVQAVGESAFQLLSTIIMLAAVWWVTTPEPREWENAGSTSRVVARYGYAASLGLSLIALAMVAAVPIAAGVSELLGGLCGLIGMFALFVYYRTLALRIPDASLAKQTQTVMWGLGITMAVAIVGTFVGALILGFGTTGTPGGGGGGGLAAGAGGGIIAVGCVIGVAALVFGIWAIVLAFQYSSRFQRAADMARRNDAAVGPGPGSDEPWNRGLA